MNAIGVDVGGTKIAAGVVTPGGEILDEVRYPTPHSPGTLVETIVRAVTEVGEGYEAAGACLAVPGLVLARENKVVFSPNLHAVEGIPLKDEVEPRIGLPLTAGERRQRGGMGRVPVRGGQRGRSPGLRHAGDRHRWWRHNPRRPDAWGAGLRRRARPRDDPGHGTPLRLRQPRLPGGPRLGHRHSAPRP